ncbi:NADH:flavin oxidoreductase [Clostridium chromiireducens]|uniref:NADH:flavin oxidoreductase n=1 Tax=Clostridium chromiireducens TaxID=225345 RepID=UPI003AF4A310
MKKLLDTTKLGNMTLKNRFIRSAIGDYAIDGHLNEKIFETYENLAKGGVGTIITGFALVDKAEKSASILAMYDDSFIEEYEKLTNKVHEHGANIVLQLVYTGSFAMGDVTGKTVLGASAVANLINGIVPKEMDIDEIKSVQKKFAQAALRAKKAGFDGIEIHGAHGFLLNQFITPYYNQRKDIYGGTIENRARMLVETYSAIRDAVGEEYPVFAKVNSTDGFEGGMTLDDCRYVCKELDRLGIDAIEVSGNWYQLSSSGKKETYFKDEATVLAKDNKAVIIVTGYNREYEKMEQLLNTDGIEYFGMARPFISEPDLVNKYEKENVKKVKCISCNACAIPENEGRCILNKNK